MLVTFGISQNARYELRAQVSASVADFNTTDVVRQFEFTGPSIILRYFGLEDVLEQRNGYLEPGSYLVEIRTVNKSVVSFVGSSATNTAFWLLNLRFFKIADLDSNGSVTLTDYGTLFSCLTGAASETCDSSDLDSDGAVNLRDFAEFQIQLGSQ